MNERDRLIEQLIRERGGTREQYLHLLNAIAFHESDGTFDPKIKQYSGGPGRGKYQFEKGRAQGANTALNRTKNYYKELGFDVPKWIQNASKQKDFDVTSLTDQQQDILFLANMRKHPKADYRNLWEGKQTIPEFWANYHWAGPQRERAKMQRKFQGDYKRFNELEKVQPPTEEEVRAIPEQVKDGVNIKQPQPLENIINKYGGAPNIAALGGMLRDKNLNSYDAGGRHEMNPHGGIPQGMGSNGKMNTVEQGEAAFKFPEGKFIFSDRINVMAEGGPTDPPSKDKQLAVEQESADFITNWFNSPVTRYRLSQNTGQSPVNLIKPVNEWLGNIENRPESLLNVPTSNSAEGAETKGGRIQYYRDVNPADSTHELMHVAGVDDVMQPIIKEKWGTPIQAIQEKYGLPYNEAINKAYNITEDDGLIGEGLRQGVKKHFGDLSGMDGKTELYPRIMEMRRIMNVKPGQKIDTKLLEKAKKGMADKAMFKAYTDEQILDMLNTLAANTSKQNYDNLV